MLQCKLLTLEATITEIEAYTDKLNQYNRRNNFEVSGISNEIPEKNLENNVIKICKNSNVIINHTVIEGCHCDCLPLGRNSTNDNKHVIVKFVNRKHSKLILHSKKSIS